MPWHIISSVTLQATLSLTLLVLLVRSVLNTLEVFARRQDYSSHGTYSWTARRRQRSWTREGFGAKVFDRLFSTSGFLILSVMQLLVSLFLTGRIVWRHEGPVLWALWLLFLLEALADLRNASFGHDGSDRMHLLVLLATVISLSFTDTTVRAVGVCFIAFAVMLAYFTAGAVKALAPRWRDGRAMAVVLCSENYGTPRVGRWLLKHRLLSTVLGWSVIGFELAFPFLVWWRPNLTLSVLALAFVFHVGVAIFMGLNSFVWSFAATYPSVYWLSTKWYVLMKQ